MYVGFFEILGDLGLFSQISMLLGFFRQNLEFILVSYIRLGKFWPHFILNSYPGSSRASRGPGQTPCRLDTSFSLLVVG